MVGTTECKELFTRYEGNPILEPATWPYQVAGVYNPGATMFNDEVLLLVRVEERTGFSHLAIATSKDGRTGWRIGQKPALEADARYNEAVPGLEDPRIVWMEERQEYIIACVSFVLRVVGQPSGISLFATKDFIHFERLGQQLMPTNKNASLFPKTFKGLYGLINRPIIEGRGDIWVSFSPNLRYWGDHRPLLLARHRSWDAERIGIGPPPIETAEGWLVIYHGTRATAGGSVYRVGLALLDLETLEVIHRSKVWVFGPEKNYEQVGCVDDIVFPCGAVVHEKTREILMYYGAADSAVGLAIANFDEVLEYLKRCPAEG